MYKSDDSLRARDVDSTDMDHRTETDCLSRAGTDQVWYIVILSPEEIIWLYQVHSNSAWGGRWRRRKTEDILYKIVKIGSHPLSSEKNEISNRNRLQSHLLLNHLQCLTEHEHLYIPNTFKERSYFHNPSYLVSILVVSSCCWVGKSCLLWVRVIIIISNQICCSVW